MDVLIIPPKIIHRHDEPVLAVTRIPIPDELPALLRPLRGADDKPPKRRLLDELADTAFDTLDQYTDTELGDILPDWWPVYTLIRGTDPAATLTLPTLGHTLPIWQGLTFTIHPDHTIDLRSRKRVWLIRWTEDGTTILPQHLHIPD